MRSLHNDTAGAKIHPQTEPIQTLANLLSSTSFHAHLNCLVVLSSRVDKDNHPAL